MIKKKDMAKNIKDIDNSDLDEMVLTNEIPKTSKIIIKKQEKVNIPKRITYYLNNSTIKKIDKYSKMAGMGKSEFVQTLLDLALDNLEIK